MSARAVAILIIALLPAAVAGQPRVDADGFPLPAGAVMRLGSLKFVASDEIRCVAMSPDGKWIASANKSIQIWNADTGRAVRTIEAKDDISALSWSRNGRLIAAMNSKTHFAVWNVQDGSPRWQKDPKEERFNVLAVRFVEDDQMVAFALDNRVVEIWPLHKPQPARTWTVDEGKRAQLKALGDSYQFSDISLSPSGELMAWLASNKTRSAVLIYETLSGKLRDVVNNLELTERIRLLDEGKTLACKPDPDGNWQRLGVVNVADGKVRFRCTYRQRYNLELNFRRHKREPTEPRELATYGNGKVLVTSDEAGMVRWDAATGKKLQEWDHQFAGVCGSEDGKRTVFAHGRRLELCDEALAPLGSGTDFTTSPFLHFQADGKLVAQVSWGDRLNIWDLRQKKLLETATRRYPQQRYILNNGSFDALGKQFAYYRFAFDGKFGVVVHDLVNDRQICRLQTSKYQKDDRVHPIISPDGNKVLIAEPVKDGSLVRWFATQDGRELGKYLIDGTALTAADWHGVNGSKISYVDRNSQLKIVDCATGKLSQVIGSAVPLSDHELEDRKGQAVWGYTQEAFGRMVKAFRLPISVVESKQEDLYVYDAASGRRLRRFHSSEAYVFLSPDGRLGASLHGHIYETATGRLRGRLAVDDIQTCAFSPDGRMIAASCKDTTILIWDLQGNWNGKPALPGPRSMEDADKLWQTLGDSDLQVAEPALRALVDAPDRTLPMLRKRLQPVLPRAADWLRVRIAKLDSNSFRDRVQATADLLHAGDQAVPALQAQGRAAAVSLEQKRRIEELLARIDGPTTLLSHLRELRAVEVLERIGSADARTLLESIASGDPASSLTFEAQLALGRMPKR